MSRTVNLGKIVPERGTDYWTAQDKAEIISTATTNVENNFASTIATIQSNSNNALNTANTANSTANTAKSIAEGANQALSYTNYQAMITAFNELADNVYKVGQNIMIITLNVPDLWISAIENTSITYNYTNDEAITTALSTNGYIQVGYYKLSALETQKVDLTDYYTKTGTENKIEDYLYQIMPTDSASGTIATINDATTMFNAIDVSGTIEPVQDLHGYDSPWSAGGGKNLCPMVFNDIKTLNTYGTWTDNKYVFRGITLTIEQDAAGNCIGITANGTASQDISFTFTTPFELDGTYILSGCPSDGNGTTTYNVRILETGKGSVVTSDYGNGSTFTATKTVRARITIYNGYTASNLKFYPMLRLSSITDDTYAPYSNICPISGWNGMTVNANGTEIPISWESEAGTVYGGSLDVTTGVLTVDRAIKTLTNSDYFSIQISTGTNTTNRITASFYETVGKINGVLISDSLNTARNSTGGYATSAWMIWGSTVAPRCWISVPVEIDTVNKFKSYLSSNPIQIVYELATPQTYQLTPQQISFLLGTNNLWVDTGDINVTYKADIQKYIDKKIN